MLLYLSIRDVVIIHQLDLTFFEGLNVLTGETGAGKSILLDALGLALGNRGDLSLIRKGCESASVSAEFFIEGNLSICDYLREQGIEPGETLVLRRVLTANGRSRAFVDDQSVSTNLLKQLGGMLLEVHGQFDHLLDSKSHRAYLDAYAQAQDLCATVSSLYEAWYSAIKEYEATLAKDKKIRDNEDYLRFQLMELRALDPIENEEDALLEKRQKIVQGTKLRQAFAQARDEVSQAISALHTAEKSLAKTHVIESSCVDKIIASLQRGDIEIQESLNEILRQESHVSVSEDASDIDERLHTLRDMARKHRVQVADLPKTLSQIQEDLAALDKSSERLEKLIRLKESAFNDYQKSAEVLSKMRIAAAQSLVEAVMTELPALKLDQAKFDVAVERLDQSQWGAEGLDRVNFQIAANKGQSLSDLAKAASGGERSRLMLALKAVFADQATLSTMIFDEIDTGVGGAVATAIGGRLAKLATQLQVLTITHSPQVAAAGHHHYFIEKQEQDGVMATQVRMLTLPERQEEIARMLSGVDVTEEARGQAKRLMQSC